MNASALRRVLATAALACAATGGLALAQAADLPAGNFGGGAIAVPVDEDTVAGDMLLSVRAKAGGKIGVDGQLYASCGPATIKGDAKLAADGSFTLRGEARRRPVAGVTETTTFVVKGTLTIDGGSGTASATLKIDPRRGETKTCKSRTVNWTLRRAGEPAPPAPAPAAGSTLYGLTSQSGPRAKRAIVLHATDGGRSIDRLVFSYRPSCDKRRIDATDGQNFSPEFPVAADGSFRTVERFKVTFSDVIQRVTIVIRGQFDLVGGATGKVSVTERYTNRRNGRRVDVCDTGARSWTARS